MSDFWPIWASSGSFGIIESVLVTLKIEYRLSHYLGAYAVPQITLLHMKRRKKKTSLRVSLFFKFFVSKDNLLDSHYIKVQVSVIKTLKHPRNFRICS